jgi:hypothetical protein
MTIEAKCCWPGCAVAVTGPHIVCLDHWRALPGHVRTAVQMRIRGWGNKGAARQYVADWSKQQQKGYAR